MRDVKLPYLNTQTQIVGMMNPDQAAVFGHLFVLTTLPPQQWPPPPPSDVDLHADPENPGYYRP